MIQNIAVVTFLLVSGSVANAEQKQTLVIDSQHLMAGNQKNQVAYTIKPTQKLVIDYSKYKFQPGTNGKISKPDTMSMIVDNSRQYYYKITGNKTKHTLSANTLTHRVGFKSFTGLKAGDKFILAIGNLVNDKRGTKQIFKVAWIGVVNVAK